jgi:hypothetical protein
MKGSPKEYNAETGSQQPVQKRHSGEPNERKTLYRLRRPQKEHQLLRQPMAGLWKKTK